MKIIQRGDILNVSDICELSARTCESFRTELQAFLPAGIKEIRVDLSHASFVDCRGLGSLVSLRQKTSGRSVSLVNAPVAIRRMACLARLEAILPAEASIGRCSGSDGGMEMPVTVSVSQPIGTSSVEVQTPAPANAPGNTVNSVIQTCEDA